MWISSENEPGLKVVEPNTAHCIIVGCRASAEAAWGTPSPRWAEPHCLVPSPGHANVFPTSHKSGTCPFKMHLM